MPDFFFIFNLPLTILSTDDYRYSNCNVDFDCGFISNISYPFWGGNQPEYCGNPGFQLECKDGTPIVHIHSQGYGVLDINPDKQTMVIGWWKNCPREDSYKTLVDSPITLSDSRNRNVTVFYHCPLLHTELPNKLQCESFGTKMDAWISSDTNITQKHPELLNCKAAVIPVPGTAHSKFNQTSLKLDVLQAGFEVKYSMNVSICPECERSVGECGYNRITHRLECYCPNGLYEVSCPNPRKTSTPGTARKKVIAAIIAAGTLAALITMATILIWCWLRKKSNGSIILWKKKSRNGRAVEAFFKDCEFLAPRKFKYKDIKKMTNSFNDKVGQGGFGSVFKGKLPDGHMVAVKVLNETKGDGNDFINEVASISRTSHVNIVTLLGFCINGPQRALVYEFMPNGSLEKFIYGERPLQTRHLGWVELYRVAIGIARGLEYLHRGCNTRIVHFDIKPHNILLDENFIPKIADFGLSKLSNVTQSIVSMTGARGTPGYIAPELVSRGIGEVSHKSDVYSYGMMVLEMVGGRKNIDVRVTNLSEIYFSHWIHKRLDMNEGLGLHGVTSLEDHGIARKMILVGLWCIQINPTSRPPMSKVLEMLEGSLEALQLPPKPYLSSLSNEDEGSHSSVSSL